MSSARVAELEQEIRDRLNRNPRLRAQFSREDWYVICSALDVIGDLEILYGEFLKSGSANPSLDYLRIYGLLQALVVQQEAVDDLGRRLRCPVHSKGVKILADIREIRHRAIGHPTGVYDGKTWTGSAIARSSISSDSFRLMRFVLSTQTPEFQDIHLPSLITKQQKALSRELTKILKHLAAQENRHRQTHRASELTNCFHKSTPYMLGKVAEEIEHFDNDAERGGGNLSILLDQVSDFCSQLETRSEGDRVADLKERAIHADQRIRSFLSGDPTLFILDARAFYRDFEEAIMAMISLAEAVDAEYANDV